MVEYKPPFPWFGGKSRAAKYIWERLGNVANYIEPFFGSGANLFLRPHEPAIETVNDKDCFVSNFWRATKYDVEEVARFADWPVNEADLHARHQWLINQNEFIERMKTDPDYFDAKIAGFWVWGISCWIGGEWCKIKDKISRRMPHLSDAGQGMHRQRPHLGHAGQGMHRQINRKGTTEIIEYMQKISNRLRNVRVCCGDWKRVTGESVTIKNGTTGILLDPPYNQHERDLLYSIDENFFEDVWTWAIENGNNNMLRIAVCGYDDGRETPKGWEKFSWKTNGGYANQSKKESRAKKNAIRETIWFSPYCLNAKQKSLF